MYQQLLLFMTYYIRKLGEIQGRKGSGLNLCEAKRESTLAQQDMVVELHEGTHYANR